MYAHIQEPNQGMLYSIPILRCPIQKHVQLLNIHVDILQITSLKVEPIIRGGLRRFTDMIGQLWCSLADYYIRGGHFEKVSNLIPNTQSFTLYTIVRLFQCIYYTHTNTHTHTHTHAHRPVTFTKKPSRLSLQ